MLVGGSEAKVNPLSLSRFNLFAQSRSGTTTRKGRSAHSTATATAPRPAKAPRSSRSKLSTTPRRGRRKIYGEVVAVATGVDRGTNRTRAWPA